MHLPLDQTGNTVRLRSFMKLTILLYMVNANAVLHSSAIKSWLQLLFSCVGLQRGVLCSFRVVLQNASIENFLEETRLISKIIIFA